MKSTLLLLVLFITTGAVVAFYPTQSTGSASNGQTELHSAAVQAVQRPKIDVVFVLDTTGSMSGLIQTAKEKIWSIASTMTSAQPAPEIRMGLVAYRDRGDDYVTRVVDLSSDIDSMYGQLMNLTASGGGDGPESVNEALERAVDGMSWNRDRDTYRVIFLVGDAPPHMDYVDDAKYPQTVARAARNGIVVNTIQCGQEAETRQRWQDIAARGQGRYFSVDQAGSAVAIATPFDAGLAKLSAALDATRLYYGDAVERERFARKLSATAKLHAAASPAAQARRAAFNASAAGEANLAGKGDLVGDVASGRVDLATVKDELLPEPLRTVSVDERKRIVAEAAAKRADLKRQIQVLAEQRDEYATAQIAAQGGAAASLDVKILDAVREQTKSQGLHYDAAPKY